MNEKEQLYQIIESEKSVKKHQVVIDCYTALSNNIEDGKSWPTEELADILQCKPNTLKFGVRIAEVKRLLEMNNGYHLTSRGKNGLEYFVQDLRLNHRTMQQMQKEGISLFERAVRLGVATIREHGDKLTDMERYKIEKETEIAAKRTILSKSIKSTVKKLK